MSDRGFIQWLALLLAACALYLSWITYDKVSDEKLADLIQEQTSETYQELEDRIMRRNATSTATTTASTTPDSD